MRMGFRWNSLGNLRNKYEKINPLFLKEFGKQFYGVNFINHPVSNELLEWTFSLGLRACPKAMIECMKSFSQTDFRKELSLVKIARTYYSRRQ